MSTVRALGAFLLVSMLSVAASATDTLRVRADVWMPFNGGAAEAPGYVTEVLQAIFAPKDMTVQYENIAWEKALEACRAGEIEAVPCTNEKEAKGLVLPKETIAEIQYGMFVLKESAWKLAGVQSFERQRIGSAAGYTYWDVLDRYLETHPEAVVKLSEEETCLDGVKKLQAREIDLLPECPQVFFWTLKSNGIDAAQFRLACRMPGEAVFVAFCPGPKGKALAKAFDAGMQQLRASGRLAKILAKYNVQDWK